MANWAGFSEEDLKKLNAPNGNGQKVQRKPQSKARPQRAVQPMKKQSRDVSQSVSLSQSNDLPAAARLSHPAPSTQQQVRGDGGSVPANNSNNTDTSARHAEEVEVNTAAAEATVPVLQPQVSAEVLTEDDGRNRDLTNLQQYQQQQKMMEELNKKKKQMLAEALVQRQKQANVEAKKLNSIKKELSALDQMLTADVSLIRDSIEEATREYADANKRYELAEKEYIASKMNLHKKSELKEQLTEHLYTIIHQNEVRKAKKLADLMDALNLATEECDTENNSTLPDLPSFSLLGNMQTVASGNLVQHTTPVTSPQTDAPTTTPAATPPTATPQTEAVTLPTTDKQNTSNIQSDNSSNTTLAKPEISSNEVTSDKLDKAKTDIQPTEGNSKHIESSDSSRNATPNAGVLSDDDLK